MAQRISLEINEQTLPIIEQITEGIPGGFFIYHADDKKEIIYHNKAMLEILGCKSEETFLDLTGNSFHGIVHPDDKERVVSSIWKQIGESKYDLDHVEYRVRKRNGDIAWIRHYGHFVHNEELGDLFYVFINDATQMHAEMEARERQNYVIQALSREYYAVYIVDCETCLMQPIRMESVVAKSLFQMIGGSNRFDLAIAEFAMHFVVSEEREMFLKEAYLPHLQHELKDKDFYRFSFRRYNEHGYPEYIQMAAARIKEGSPRIIIGLKPLADELFDIHANMNHYFKSVFYSAYYVDMITDEGIVAFNKGLSSDGFAEHIPDFWEHIDAAFKTRVMSKDYKAVSEFASKGNLKKHLKEVGDTVTTTFRDIWRGDIRQLEMTVCLLSKEGIRPKNILMGFRVIPTDDNK